QLSRVDRARRARAQAPRLALGRRPGGARGDARQGAAVDECVRCPARGASRAGPLGAGRALQRRRRLPVHALWLARRRWRRHESLPAPGGAPRSRCATPGRAASPGRGGQLIRRSAVACFGDAATGVVRQSRSSATSPLSTASNSPQPWPSMLYRHTMSSRAHRLVDALAHRQYDANEESSDRGPEKTMTRVSVDSLSFTVREVDSPEDMARVCELRAECYGRRAPALREPMAHPDAFDLSPSTTVFLCEDKTSGELVGTMRVVDNTLDGDLDIEEFIEVPGWLSSSRRGEMTRLVVAPGADPLVKAALWKAGYLRCLQARVQWLIIAARKPGLIK